MSQNFFEGSNACKVWEPLLWMICDASVVNIPCLVPKLLTSVGVSDVLIYRANIEVTLLFILSDAYLLLKLLIRWWLCYLFIKRTRAIYVQGGSNMTRTDLCVNKPHCAAAVRP